MMDIAFWIAVGSGVIFQAKELNPFNVLFFITILFWQSFSSDIKLSVSIYALWPYADIDLGQHWLR